MLTFDKKFFVFALALFITEVLIAVFLHDSFVRPHVGDYLVVILVYCSVRTVLDLPVVKTAIGVLLFSYLIEVLQFFNIVAKLGLEHNSIAKTVIGTGFDWSDLLAYTLGILTVLALERRNLGDKRNVKIMS